MFSSAFHRLYGSSRFITNSVIPFSSFGKGTAFLSIQSGNREAPHFKRSTGAHPLEKEEESRYSLPHPIWSSHYLNFQLPALHHFSDVIFH
eukprot:m.12421 g.12421  ORF g.12421 m.12421 type:complete len:91 (+) comp24036_c0_seq4:39-311(+)